MRVRREVLLQEEGRLYVGETWYPLRKKNNRPTDAASSVPMPLSGVQ